MPPESNNKPAISDPKRVLPDFLPILVLEQVFNYLYPIGSIYFNKTDSRNPSQIFGIGCGVWTLETGKFLVGKAASGTFTTLGATGGAETVTLTTAQIPSHVHGNWLASYGGGIVNSSQFVVTQNGAHPDYKWKAETDAAGGGGSHPNLPPYTVVNIWVRTA